MATRYPLVLNGTTIQETQAGDGIQLPTALAPQYGGMGVANNAASTQTITGAYSLGWTISAATSLTLPTSGTLATLAGTETFTNKTLTNPTVTNYVETPYSATPTSTITLDLTNGTVQIITLGGNVTFTFPTATSGKSFMLLLKQDATGSRTATWPSSVKWPSSTAPTITSTASKGDKFVFTADGTYWWGSVAGQNYL